MSDDEFVRVTRKRDRRKKLMRVIEKDAQSQRDFEADLNDIITCLDTLDFQIPDISNTSYAKTVIKHLEECLTVLTSNSISEIVCYGLGRFTKSISSKYQLALLICLWKYYDKIPVYVYDPRFSPKEIKSLQKLGLNVIEKNEEGKRVVHPDKTTLLYMPHCHFFLTNNFLYANWGTGLSKCVLLMNSLSSFVYDLMISKKNKCMVKAAGYILRIRPYITEVYLKNSFTYKSAFNSMNIHIFRKKDLLKVPTGFWEDRKEPNYQELQNKCDIIRASEQL